MLYSPSAGIAFAHYPKTAGHSLVEWFRGTFPDARFVEPDPVHPISHLPVHESLVRLGFLPGRSRGLGRVGRRITGACVRLVAGAPRMPRIIGAVREPFSMLVSLFEYWRDYPFAAEPDSTLIRAARSGSFRAFLERAVVRGELPKYENFFDVGGPAWASTRLLDFSTLEESLAHVGREWGFSVPPGSLGRRNVGPRPRRDLEPYRDEAAPLAFAIRSRFRWYDSAVGRLLVRPAASRRAA